MEPERYIVEKIVQKRLWNGNTKYLVKWAGYPSSQNTWEPEEHLSDCPAVIEEFENRVSNSKRKSSTLEEGTSDDGENGSSNGSEQGDEKSSHSSRDSFSLGVRPNRRRSSNVGFARNLEPKEIVCAVEKDGVYCFLMRWQNCKDTDIVPAKEAHVHCPQLVISFYESRIAWKPRALCFGAK